MHAKRVVGIYLTLILLFTGLLSQMVRLSMGDSLAMTAQSQSSLVLPVDSTRGMIYDCDLRALVSTQKRTVAAVDPSPEANTALAQAVREKGETAAFLPEARQPYTVTLSQGEIYEKGIELFEVKDRYAKEQLAPHIIGYLTPDSSAGAAGIELSCNALLSQAGGDLSLRYRTDALGRTMVSDAPEVIRENYQSGAGVVLTLDSQIQYIVQEAMKNVKKGAAVVMQVDTGNLLASVSMPAYDPNHLADSLKNPDSPFVNRAFSQFNVGSTFKLVTAAAALERGVGRYAPYTCKGYIDVDGHLYYCHWRNGHGSLDLERAIDVSCNPYFINLGLIAGGKRIAAMAREIGFGRAAHLTEDLCTQSGTLPSDAELSADVPVANFAFGQGSLTATPIQVAQMISTVANGGFAVTPRLVEGYTEDGRTLYEHTFSYSPTPVFSKSTSNILRECMVSNVKNGSGVNAMPLRGMAGGKTASAQTGIYLVPGEEDSEIVHAWFAGFYPADTPKYAIVVLVEGGESGQDVAAPIFKQIADMIYLAKL